MPVAGAVTSETRIDALWDTGKARGALMVSAGACGTRPEQALLYRLTEV